MINSLITKNWLCRVVTAIPQFPASHSLNHAVATKTIINKETSRQRVCENLVLANRNYCTKIVESHVYEETAVEDEDETDFPQQLLKALSVEQQDEHTKQILAATDVDYILQLLESQSKNYQKQHFLQCILKLWTLNRSEYNIFSYIPVPDKRLYIISEGLANKVKELSVDELAYSYLYLYKMGIKPNEPTMENLLMESLNLIKSDALLPLTALSQLSVAIKRNGSFFVPLVCSDFIKHIEQHIKSYSTAEEARLLAICLRNLKPLIDNEILAAFKERVNWLCQQKIIDMHNGKTLRKILQMLNMPQWSLSNSDIIRDLLLLMRNDLKSAQFTSTHIRDICHMFQYHREPAGLTPYLREVTNERVKHKLTPETLVANLPFSQPNERARQIGQLRDMLDNDEHWSQPNAAANYFTALRELKVSDVKMCDDYWSHIANDLPSSGAALNEQLLRHCHQYMNFNNNLGGTYRYLPLEQQLSKLCMHNIVYELPGLIPWKFARLAAFVMGYGHTTNCYKKFPNLLLSKIINMSNQFTADDCYALSRGIRIALELRFRYEVPSILGMQLSTIDNILTTCAERHLQELQPTNLSELNAIVHTLANRKTLKNTVVYHEALNYYKNVDYSTLNSRIIREMCFNFGSANFVIPEAQEAMFNYLEDKSEYVLGDTVEKVIYCAYSLGYVPQSLTVFDTAAAILLRDFNHMRGLSLLKACMALGFYKALPVELINAIFCFNFIKRIEEEIRMCYSRATYPERVQNMVMQLNRAVCLDFPEANVPWFQQNFIEAQMSRKKEKKGSFMKEVKSLLQKIVKDPKYIVCNHVTPYGYQIDFVINFDRQAKLLQPELLETTMLERITKVAILLLKLDSYCENDLSALRGADSMKIKHLEMLGYKVLQINEHDWYSKYMKTNEAKTNYLKCLLQISS